MGNLFCVKSSGIGEVIDPQWHGDKLNEGLILRTLPGEGGGSSGKPGQPATPGAATYEFVRGNSFVEMIPNWETEWVDDSQAAPPAVPGAKLRAVPTGAYLYLDHGDFPNLKRGQVADELLAANARRLEMIELRQKIGGGGDSSVPEPGDQGSTTESNVAQSQANIDAAQVVSRPDDFVAQQAPAAADVQRRRPAPGSDRERKAAGADGFLTEKDVVSWNLKNPNKKIDWQEVLRRPE